MYKYFGFLLLVILLASGAFYFLDETPDNLEQAGSEIGSQHKSQLTDNNLMQQEVVTGQQTGNSDRKVESIEIEASVSTENDEVLSADEKKQLKEKLAKIDNKAVTLITDYDNNLSDVEKRKEIEGQFTNESKDFKRIALKLAKDQIASEKSEEDKR